MRSPLAPHKPACGPTCGWRDTSCEDFTVAQLRRRSSSIFRCDSDGDAVASECRRVARAAATALELGEANRRELGVLRDCLAEQGLLKPSRLAAELHRRSFQAERRRHPCHITATFEDLSMHCFATLGNYLCGPSLSELRAASECVQEKAPKAAANLYVIGGFRGWTAGPELKAAMQPAAERYDPALGCWEAVPPTTTTRIGAAGAVVAGRLYVAGGGQFVGKPNLASVERFDPDVLGGRWEEVAPMSVPRLGAVAAGAGGCLHVAGGNDGRQLLTSHERFDPAKGLWEPLAAAPQAAIGSASGCLGGRWYVCGGRDADGPVRDCSAYALDARTWAPVKPMALERFGCRGAVARGALFVCGGEDVEDAVRPSTVERFDPRTGAWEMLRQTLASYCFCPMVAALAGRVHVCGGNGEGNSMLPVGHRLATVQRLDEEQEQWEGLPPLPTPRSAGVALVAPAPRSAIV